MVGKGGLLIINSLIDLFDHANHVKLVAGERHKIAAQPQDDSVSLVRDNDGTKVGNG